MKKNLFIIAITLTFSLFSEITEINIASEAWEDGTNKDGTGFYWDLARLVYEPVGITVKYRIVPYNRSIDLVKKGVCDAWIGAYEKEETFALYPKNPIAFDNVVAVYKKSSFDSWNGMENIKSSKLAWIRGYSYDKYLDYKVNFTEIYNREYAYNMLCADRFEIFLDARYDVVAFFNKGILDINNFEVQPLMKLYLYFAYNNSDRCQELVKIWDERIEILKISGELKKFYNKYDYAEYPF